MGWEKAGFRIGLITVAAVAMAARSSAQGTVLDLDGHPASPFTGESGKAVVLVFLRRDCPVSGRYAPVIQQISKKYSDSASFWLVYPDKSETPAAVRKSVAEFGYQLPALRDPEHYLVKLSHVQITPEVAVFNRNHQLIYDGRIDDWYVDLSRARPSPTTHELEDAIRATQAGGSVVRNEVRGVGCYIADVE